MSVINFWTLHKYTCLYIWGYLLLPQFFNYSNCKHEMIPINVASRIVKWKFIWRIIRALRYVYIDLNMVKCNKLFSWYNLSPQRYGINELKVMFLRNSKLALDEWHIPKNFVNIYHQVLLARKCKCLSVSLREKIIKYACCCLWNSLYFHVKETELFVESFFKKLVKS